MSLHTTLGKALYALLLSLLIGLYAPNRIAAQSDLVFSNFTFPKTTIEQNGRFEFTYDFINSGTADINYGSASAKIYFSKDKILSADDVQMTELSIGTVYIGGGGQQLFYSFSVPINFPLGTYYFISKVEGDGTPANNTVVAPQAITVTPPAGQLLVITNVTGSTTAKPGDVIALNVTIKNQGLSASSGVNTLQYLQQDNNYLARPLSYNKLILPVIASNEEKTITVNFKLRDTLYPPNASFVTSNSGYSGYSFGDYFVSITTNNTTPNYGCFVGNGIDCTSKKYNITPIYPKANVSVSMAVSKTLLQFDEKFSTTYTVTNNGGSTVHDLFVNLGTFTNENRNYSPTSFSPIYQQEVADANTRLVAASGESNNYGWEVFDLKVGESRKVTLNFTTPFKSQYGSYGAYGTNTTTQISYPTINLKSSFENTAAPVAAKDPIKIVLDLSKIADIELSNLRIPNPTVAENGVLNFKFDLKNLGTAPIPQNFNIKSALYKDAAFNEFILEDGVVTTGNIAAGGQVLGVMGALTVKVPPGTYYLRVAAYDFASPLPELNKANNIITVATPIIVTSTSCKGDLTLETQAKVNAFNRACTAWEGRIDITGSVTDLTPLANLKSITGALTISSANQLTNVQGLNNLETVNGTFVVTNCANLTSLAALAKLNSVKTTFIVSTLPKLTELGLKTVTFNNVTHAELYDVPNLQNTGDFLIKATSLPEILLTNMGAPTINFLKGVPEIGLLQLTGNKNLLNIDGLSQTTKIDRLIVATHPKLLNLDGLSQASTINNLTIADNPVLKLCCGVASALKNITQTTPTITGNLSGCNSKTEILSSCTTSTTGTAKILVKNVTGATTVKPGATITLNITIKNEGTSAGSDSLFIYQTRIFVGNYSPSDGSAVRLTEGIVTPSLNVGETKTISVAFKVAANFVKGSYITNNLADPNALSLRETSFYLEPFFQETYIGTKNVDAKAQPYSIVYKDYLYLYDISPIYNTTDIEVTATSSQTTYDSNTESIKIKLYVKNKGIATANFVNVVPNLLFPYEDTHLQATNISKGTFRKGLTANVNGKSIATWYLENLAPNEMASIDLEYKFAPSFVKDFILGKDDFTFTAYSVAKIIDNVSNNDKATLAFTKSKGNIADLTLANLILAQVAVEKGKVLNYKFDLKNIGTANVPSNFTIKSYLSKDNVLSADDVQDGTINTGNINAGATVAQVNGALTANVAVGQYYVILKVDADNQVTESNENNNTIASVQTIAVGSATTSTNGVPRVTLNTTNKSITAKAGEIVNISLSVGNFGTGDAINTTVKGYFSIVACPVFPCSSAYFGSLSPFSIGTVSVNSLKDYPISLQLPSTIPVGVYSLLLSTEINGQTDTPNPAFLFLTLTIQEGTPTSPQTKPDFILANLTLAQTNIEKGKVLNFKFDLKNIGNANASSNFSIKSYLSKDNILSADDVQDGTINTGNINAGATVAQINGALTANVATGQYYVILKVDADNQVAESNEDNNILITAQPITVAPAATTTGKLTIVSVKADKPIPDVPNSFTVDVTFKNEGTAASAPTMVSMQHIVSLTYPGKFCSSVVQHYEPITDDVAVPSLAAGETKTLSLTFKVIGRYNPNNSVLVILNNNRRTTTAAQAPPCEVLQNTIVGNDGVYYNYVAPTPTTNLPDLTLSNLIINNTTVSQGNLLKMTAVVSNIGNLAAANFNIRGYLFKGSGFGVEEGGRAIEGDATIISTLDAGKTLTNVAINIATGTLAVGNYTLSLQINGDYSVKESNYFNNQLKATQAIIIIANNPVPTASIELTVPTTPISTKQWDWSEFEIVVKNNTNTVANNVAVKIPLPSSDFVYAVERFLPVNTVFNPINSVWTVGNLAAGASKNFKVSLYALKNNAPYKTDVTIVGTNITKTITFGGNTTPLPIANVSLSYALNKTLLSTNETFSATYTIKNNSSSTVQQSWVYLGEFDQRNYDPFTIRVATSTGAGLKTQSDTGEKTKYGWEISDLKAGEARTVTLTFEAPFKTTFANQNVYNDATTITFPVPKIQEKGMFYSTTPPNLNAYTLKFKSGTATTPQTDISVAMVTTNPTYSQYTNLTYRITVTNNGQQIVNGVKTDFNYIENGKLPFVSAKTSAGVYNSYTKIWDIGVLNSGQSVTMDLVLFPLVKGEDLAMKVTVVPTDGTPQNNTTSLILKNALNIRTETNVVTGFGIQNLYPNPVEDMLTVALKSETNGVLQVIVFDTFGRVVQKTTQNIPKNTTFMQVEVAELPEGMYILQIADTNNRIVVGKFVK